jgi:hypothetical protein
MEILLEVPITRHGVVEASTDFSTLMDVTKATNGTGIGLLDSEQNEALRSRPDILFAVAAGLAIRGRAWVEAERFADNAVTAAEPLEHFGTRSNEDAKLEYLYLQSLARRFIIASRSPTESRSDQDEWRYYLERTIKVLNSLEVSHARTGDSYRQIRAIAERVAIRLFYVSWGVCASPVLLESRGYSYEFAYLQYAAALADIRRVWQLSDASPVADRVASIMKNLSVNGASLLVIGKFLRRRQDHLEEMSAGEIARLVESIEPLMSSLDNFPKIVSLDSLAFLYFVDNRNDLRPALLAAAKDPELQLLSLDGALAGAIRGLLREEKTTPSASKSSGSQAKRKPKGSTKTK